MIQLLALITGFTAANPQSGVVLKSCTVTSFTGAKRYNVRVSFTDPNVSRVFILFATFGSDDGGGSLTVPFNRSKNDQTFTYRFSTPGTTGLDVGLLWCGVSETDRKDGSAIWQHLRSQNPIRWNEPS